MDNKYKYKDTLKVVYTGSKHYGKTGKVEEVFQSSIKNRPMPIFYNMFFTDNTTGTVEQGHLEKVDGAVTKPKMPVK